MNAEGMNIADHIVKGGKALRLGYTTGSCATAAAAAAARMLVTRSSVPSVTIRLPSGDDVAFAIGDAVIAEGAASCSVTKDAGDDPDVTHGMKIFAECVFGETDGVTLRGGEGVGVVTTPGLACAEGEPAINPTPKKMIIENVRRVCEELGESRGIRVTISAPGGGEIAKKTFNARLGIVGGISILGTTGIVEPMSEKALVDTIKLTIDRQKLADADNILISPGNYGRDYCRDALRLDIDRAVKCSNFIGETLDYVAYKGFKRALLVGHAGKFTKIAGGVMNTHSSMADCRVEIIAAHAACAGADAALARSIMECRNTDQAIMRLDEKGLTAQVFESIMEKIMFHLNNRARGAFEIEAVLFSGTTSLTVKSENADRFIQLFAED